MLLLWIQMPASPIRGGLREEPEAWEPDVPKHGIVRTAEPRFL